MPLDPQAKAFLDGLKAANAPAFHQLPVPKARAGYLRTVPLAGKPEEVARVENRTIRGPGGELPVRIYWPAGDGPFPLFVFFHGGGWVIGNLDSHDPLARSLTNRAGCVTVAVDYRLAPEHPFPAAVDDCVAATEWAAANADALNADASRLAIGGDSAGGNLAAVVAQIACERGGPPIVFQVLIYPRTRHGIDTPSARDNASGYGLSQDDAAWFQGHYLPNAADAGDPKASPLEAADLSGLPPAFVVTAEYDLLRDEGELYAERLRQAGVPAEVKRYDGMIHGFLQLGGIMDQGRQGVDDAGAALRAALHGR